jgi:hypothetical protein
MFGGGGSAAAGGAGGGCASGAIGAGGGLSINTCCRYQFHEDLLLDTQTGSVWKYDRASNALLPVERETDSFRKGLEAAGLVKALGALEEGFQGMTQAEKNRYRDVFDALHRSTTDRTKKLLGAMGQGGSAPGKVPSRAGKKR